MKKSLLYIAAAALAASALGACDDDFAYPPIAEPKSDWVDMENSTVELIKDSYWQDELNYNAPVGLTADGEEMILKGRVISSDATGNIYNNIVVRGQDGYAMTIAARPASSKKLADQFPYGAEVYINMSGLSVGRYAGLFQVGSPNGSEITFLTNDDITEHMQANSIGYPSRVDTILTDIPTVKAALNNVADMRYWMSQLVRIDGLTFQNAGQPFAESQTENRYATDAAGNRINVRCSNRSTWHMDKIPGGTGSVVGILSYFNNDWQLMMNDAAGCIGFDPSLTPDTPDTPIAADPEGEGTQTDPYNVAKALQVTNALPADTNSDKVYVKGKVVSIDEIDTGSYGNATYSIADLDGGESFKIFRGYYLNGDKFTSTDQLKVGDEVVVYGALVNFKGNTPEMAQGNNLYSVNGKTGSNGGDTPATPGTPEGAGTETDPYNAAKALEVTAALPADTNSEKVYVKGTISNIKEIDTGSYGNATYYINDGEGTAEFYIFRGYYFNGDKFTAADQIKVGDVVVVYGALVNFKGNTPEMAQGSSIISINGETSGTTPDPTPDPNPDPVNPGQVVTIDPINIPHGETASSTGDVTGSYSLDGYTITIDKASGATAPAVNVYNGVGTLRIYADNTLTVASSAKIAKIVFTLNTSTGAKRYTTLTPNTGALAAEQTAADTSITWNGDATSVTFTVGHDATLGSDGSSKRGQVHISGIEITPAE